MQRTKEKNSSQWGKRSRRMIKAWPTHHWCCQFQHFLAQTPSTEHHVSCIYCTACTLHYVYQIHVEMGTYISITQDEVNWAFPHISHTSLVNCYVAFKMPRTKESFSLLLPAESCAANHSQHPGFASVTCNQCTQIFLLESLLHGKCWTLIRVRIIFSSAFFFSLQRRPQQVSHSGRALFDTFKTNSAI